MRAVCSLGSALRRQDGFKRLIESISSIISFKFLSGLFEPLGLLGLTKLFCLFSRRLFSGGIGFRARRHTASHLALVVS
jgi:hypothetical protein